MAVDPYHYDESGRNAGEQVDQALSVPTVKEACPDVGHLEAGAYDQDVFFLVTKCDSAELGTYIRIGFDSDTGQHLAPCEVHWVRQLAHFLEVMGWTDRTDTAGPGWSVIADES